MWKRKFRNAYPSPINQRIFAVVNAVNSINDLDIYLNSPQVSLPTTINDLKDREFSGSSLESDEKEALVRFDAFRIWFLNESPTEEEFHERYARLNAMANLSSYLVFLKDEFNVQQD